MSVPELKKSEKVFAKVMWDRTNKSYRTPISMGGGECEKRGGDAMAGSTTVPLQPSHRGQQW